MIGTGGWSVRNLLEPHNLAIILLVVLALAFLGVIHLGFRGAVVI